MVSFYAILSWLVLLSGIAHIFGMTNAVPAVLLRSTNGLNWYRSAFASLQSVNRMGWWLLA
jgi:hypothetical protein